MTMLYKVAEGAVENTHYGLALARVVPLPPGLVERATYVAQKLERHVQKRKKASVAVIKERRRKLILNLKEHLVQAQSGVMEGDVLTAWLKELQKEFVTRMTAIDAEAARAEEDSESEDEEADGDGDEDMRERSMRSGGSYEREDRLETSGSQPSVISVDSRITSTESESTMRAVSENER